jgi:hypothetical protein
MVYNPTYNWGPHPYTFHRFSLRLVHLGIYHVFRTPFSQGQVREGDLHLGGDFGEGEMAAQEAGESFDAFTQISYVFMNS